MPTNDVAERLDDREFIARLDPNGIFGLTRGFPSQCAEGVAHGERIDLAALDCDYSAVVLAGVGGSACAGDFLQAIFDTAGSVPFAVSREYGIPAWVGLRTLVICSSYSGNTEETLSAFSRAREQGAMILAVTSGGELAAKALGPRCHLLRIPGGQPPRTALGFSLMSILTVLRRLLLVDVADEPGLTSFLASCVDEWEEGVPFEANEAKQLASSIYCTTPVLSGLGGWQGAVAKRWKAQINENAKAHAFANSIPELNHNEILGWRGVDEERAWSCVILEDGGESAKMQTRARFTLDSLPKQVVTRRANARGVSLIERMLALSLLGDYVSLYLAVLYGVDPGDIRLLDRLKKELSQVR